MGNFNEGLGRDVQTVLRELTEKVDKQQQIITLLTKMLKKTDLKVDNISAEMINRRREEDGKFSKLDEKITQQEKIVRSNSDSLKNVEKQMAEQSKEVQKMNGEFSKEVKAVEQVKQNVKNIDDQMKYLGKKLN